MLAESSAANVEIASKQADALKVFFLYIQKIELYCYALFQQMLAECSAASVKATESLAEAMTRMGEGLKACADAFNNLTNAIYRV